MNPNRHKSKRPRHKNDLYITPPELALAAMFYAFEYWYRKDWHYYVDGHALHFVDAGAGNGVWGDALRRVTRGFDQSIYLTGVELEEKGDAGLTVYNEWYECDYMEYLPPLPVHAVFGNPPFSLAEEFIRYSWEFLEPGGYIYFLLRTGFISSKKRHFGLYKDTALKHFVQITRRPSWFTTKEGRKTTDMIDYAMFMWQKGWKGEWTGDWLYWAYD